MTRLKLVASLVCVLVLTGCASRRPPAVVNTAPRYPAFSQPDVPPDLAATVAVRRSYDAGWRWFQAGDLRAATRAFADILRQAPGFYPAEAALGDIGLVGRQFKDALRYFSSALDRNGRYLPALDGQVQAALGVGDDVVTANALERLLSVDPSREDARGRLDLVRLRVVQGQLDAAGRARASGRLDEAQTIVETALRVAPDSPVLLRELAAIELARGAADAAEQHARRAVDIDGSDPESLAALGGVLDAEGKTAEAAELYARAVSVDPRAPWRSKLEALRARVRYDARPADYRSIPTAPTVTRGQVAAAIGIDLDAIVSRAPRRLALVVTDVRTHWAAAWILPVVQTGIMDALPNHTFQPNAVVRRSDLAQVVMHVLDLVAPGDPAAAARSRSARPRLDDVPSGHVSYRAIASSVAAGVMTVDEAGRFWPGRPASGADLTAAIARLKQLAR